jgi:multiple sugar transport system permease protein
MALPSALLLLGLNGYPVVYAANQSLHAGNLIQTGPWVGFSNYSAVLGSSVFWSAAWFTLIFTVVGVFGSWAVGLAFALVLRGDVPGRNVFKTLLLLPWVVPIVVSSMSWNWFVATPTSPVPAIAHALGLGRPLFLASPLLAKVIVCVFKVWGSFPFMMLMSSAALASVDPMLYQAASVDGASRWRQFVHVTLPMIAPTTYVSWILMAIFCVNDFPTIYLLTGGGPVNSSSTLVVLAYKAVFQNFQTGPGTAIAFITTIAALVVAIVCYRRIRKSRHVI